MDSIDILRLRLEAFEQLDLETRFFDCLEEVQMRDALGKREWILLGKVYLKRKLYSSAESCLQQIRDLNHQTGSQRQSMIESEMFSSMSLNPNIRKLELFRTLGYSAQEDY